MDDWLDLASQTAGPAKTFDWDVLITDRSVVRESCDVPPIDSGSGWDNLLVTVGEAGASEIVALPESEDLKEPEGTTTLTGFRGLVAQATAELHVVPQPLDPQVFNSSSNSSSNTEVFVRSSKLDSSSKLSF